MKHNGIKYFFQMEISIVSIHTYLRDFLFLISGFLLQATSYDFRVNHNSKNGQAKVNDIKLCFNN